MTIPHFVVRSLLFALAAIFAGYAAAQETRVEYQLGPGDTIRILVYQNPDLTLETRINENGNIRFPLIGNVTIGAKSVAAAELTIAIALKGGGFIKQPYVSIIPVAMRSQLVSVLGSVATPGRFPLETVGVRVSEMIAVAGGIPESGGDVAILTGVRKGKKIRLEIDVPGLFIDRGVQNDPVVEGGDVIYVQRMPMFYVYGEVQRPGAYRIERGMTIRQALVQGGGLTPSGTERGLSVLREVSGSIRKLKPELDNAVRSNDVLYVGRSLF